MRGETDEFSALFADSVSSPNHWLVRRGFYILLFALSDKPAHRWVAVQVSIAAPPPILFVVCLAQAIHLSALGVSIAALVKVTSRHGIILFWVYVEATQLIQIRLICYMQIFVMSSWSSIVKLANITVVWEILAPRIKFFSVSGLLILLKAWIMIIPFKINIFGETTMAIASSCN